MKNSFLFFVLAFNFYCINKTYSQKTISLNTISNNGYDLSRHSKIDVVCNLPDSNNLGYVPSDIPNDRKFIKSSGAVTAWLQTFADKQFVAKADIKAKKLLWVIQDLSMGKDSTQKQDYSFLKLKADIYAAGEQDNAIYQLVNTYDSTWLTSNENADFGQMIAAAFVELYKNSFEFTKSVANNRFQQSTERFTGAKDEIIRNVKPGNNYPILKNKYATGIFTSFDEFKNNTPSIKNFYADINPKNKEVELYGITTDSSVSLIQKAWGLSINNELYFYTEGRLYPIEKNGATFYMAKYLEPQTRKNQAMYWRRYVGEKQTNSNPYSDTHVLRKTVSTAKGVPLEATHLDFDLGDFTY